MAIELNNVSSGYSTGVINDNFEAIEAYINDNLLNRDGTSTGEANQMELSLDMNSNFVYNLPEPILEHQAARLQDVQNALADNAANLITFTPYGNISSENVQGAIQELVDEAGELSVTTSTGEQTVAEALNNRASNLENFTLFVRDTGDDLNDGLTEETAVREIRKAIEILNDLSPIVRDTITIDVGAGTYKGQIVIPRGLSQRSFITIKGPDVGGHPNTPTAIIDLAADNTATRGIISSGRNKVWVEDIKVTGAFSIGSQGDFGSRFEYRNFHCDGANVGVRSGNESRYFFRGGLIENCGLGIEELFTSVRSFAGVSLRSDQVTIRNCDVGVKAKENCSGHISPITIEDCQVGVEFQAWTTGNFGSGNGALIQRCDIGVVLTNSEMHDETSGNFGTGADANDVNILSLGNSSEIRSFGWSSGPPYPVRTGHRPQVPFFNDFTEISHTGTISETEIYDTDFVLTSRAYSVEGKAFWFESTGTVGTTVSDITINFRLAGTFIGAYTIPSGSGTRGFNIKCHITSKTDGNSQLVRVEGITNGSQPEISVANRSADLLGASARNLTLSATLGDSGDSVTFLKGELMA